MAHESICDDLRRSRGSSPERQAPKRNFKEGPLFTGCEGSVVERSKACRSFVKHIYTHMHMHNMYIHKFFI